MPVLVLKNSRALFTPAAFVDGAGDQLFFCSSLAK
jgi:hypothetical protein